ncbi:MAG: polysaccharide biosynthesis protein [Defluviitaleaceae bacterium]|nr:polysaccharide biosynthesis protein [Defluviitaleaceae bacterium]
MNDENDIKLIGVKSGSFVKQAATLAGASLFVRILGFFFRVPLTNLIADEGNIFYAAAYSIYAFALNLSSIFMIATVSRLVSERLALKQYRNAHSLFKMSMLISLVLGAAGSLIMFFGAAQLVRLFSFPENTVYAVRAVSPAVFIVSILTVLRGYFMGMKTSFPTAISQVVEQIFNVGFSLWLAFLFFDAANVQYAAAGATAGTAISALAALGVVAFMYFQVAKALKKRANEDTTEFVEKPRQQLAEITRTALPIIISAATFSIMNILDIGMANSRIMASGAFTEAETRVLTGQFTGKFILLTTLPVSLSMALAAAVLPEITASHVTENQDAVRHKTDLALRLSMMLSIPAAMGLGVLADPILALLFPLHPEGGWLLRYGAVSIVFVALVHIVTGVLQGVGKVKLPVIGLVVGLVVKIPLNYFLMSIPSINILGAVISTIVCFAVAAVVNIILLRKYTGIVPDITGALLKPTIAAIGMGLVCYAAYNLMNLFTINAISTLGALVLGVVSYTLFMVLIKGFQPKDLDALPIPRKIKKFLYRG